MGFLLRRRSREAQPIREAEAYERLHGDRSGEVLAVSVVEKPPIPRRTGDLTGELLRRAFESKLDARAHDRASAG